MEWPYQNKWAWNRIKIRMGILVSIMLIAVSAFSQAKFYTRVDQQVVGKNQPVQVQFIIENAKTILEFRPPAFDDFNVIQGPMESSGMSVINGNVTQYKSLVFLLQPKEPGKVDIKGATARIDGHRMRSNNISIEVTNKSVAPSNPAPTFNFSFPGDRAEAEREYYLRPGENPIDKIKKNLFVKVEVNKTSCYVNEPIVATYKLYSRLRSESRVVKRPSYNGFSVYDMIEPDGSVSTTETLNGKEYNVHLIRQSQLFPLQAGTFTLDPVEIENQVSFIRTNGDQANSFDEIFNPTGEEVDQTMNLSSKPVTINVKPLPTANQPASFDGAVGNFKLSWALASDTVHAGDLTSLTVKVSGKGNLPIINMASLKLPDGFEAYDPKTAEDFHPESVPLSGAKTFKFPISATKAGKYVIQPMRFSFFDPSSKSYKTDSTRSLSIDVLPPLPGHDKKQSITPLLSTGIRIPESILIGVVSIIALTLLIIAFVFYRRAEKRKRIAREEMLARERAMKTLRVDPLEKARMLMAKGDQLAFLKEMENVIWKKTADSLSIPRALLNQPRVMEEFKWRGAEDSSQLFRELVNACETMLYIPGSHPENLQDILEKTEVYFGKLDSLNA